MITPKTQYNLQNAREYFREHLTHGDYHSEQQTITGHWFGHSAHLLGLSGHVQETDFLRLCEGRSPRTGGRLTQRLNTVRDEDGTAKPNRRVFFDFVFRPPKSVSLVALCADARVIDLHHEAVREALSELEKYAATRVRRHGARTNRITGNFVTALFCHETSRALDPLLHTHAVIFNATFDRVEERWKALENSEMLKAQKLASAVYDASLTSGLIKLGYPIRRHRQSFEIASIARSTIEKFSKRRRQIEQIAVSKAASGVEIFRARDFVAQAYRDRKIKDANASTLRSVWMAAMTEAERGSLIPKNEQAKDPAPALSEALRIADGMLFERESVVTRRQLEAAILSETIGSGVTLADVRRALDGDRYIRAADEFAARDNLAAEMAVLKVARAGKNKRPPLNASFDANRPELDAEQQAAVTQILRSRDFITLFRGAAGTGKSRTLSTLATAIRNAGHPLLILAPQASQVRSLLQEHSLSGQTVARLLATKEIQKNATVIVDEAGQIGARQMRALTELVRGADGRLILSGDTRQHGAVEASDGLVILEKFAGLRPAELSHIRRQDPAVATTPWEGAQIAQYREAVSLAAQGKVAASLTRLESLGVVHTVARDERLKAVASAVLKELLRGADVLAVTQTRAEAADVNEAITTQCVTAGLIRDPRPIESIVPRDTLRIERQLPRTYAEGDEIQFVRPYGSHNAGEICRVQCVEESSLILEPTANRRHPSRVSLRYADKWNVIDRMDVTLGVNSRVQLKFNGRSVEGRKVVNGELCTVRRILRDGTLIVEDPTGARKSLGPDQRVLLPGYCVTSYSSQGKTVDAVILSDSGNPDASSQREWYVSISRARQRIQVFTSDLQDLDRRIRQPGHERLALELTPKLRRPPLSSAQRLRLVRRLGMRFVRRLTQTSDRLWQRP